MGSDGKLAIHRLVEALKDPDELTRRASAEALIKIGAPNRDDLSFLIDFLKDSKSEVRRYVASAIGQIGPEAASAAQRWSIPFRIATNSYAKAPCARWEIWDAA